MSLGSRTTERQYLLDALNGRRLRPSKVEEVLAAFDAGVRAEEALRAEAAERARWETLAATEKGMRRGAEEALRQIASGSLSRVSMMRAAKAGLAAVPEDDFSDDPQAHLQGHGAVPEENQPD